MRSVRIKGATRELGRPLGWDEQRNGPCDSLHVRDERWGAMPCMVSAYKLSEEELAKLSAGGYIVLHVIGEVHPPVALSVELGAEDGR